MKHAHPSSFRILGAAVLLAPLGAATTLALGGAVADDEVSLTVYSSADPEGSTRSGSSRSSGKGGTATSPGACQASEWSAANGPSLSTRG